MTTTSIKVTKEQASALRKADTVLFHFRDGEHFIRAIKKDRDEFGETQREIRIDVQGRIEKYDVRRTDLGEVEECCSYMSYAKDTPHLSTAFSGIREGDIIYLRWLANNNNDLLNRVGLYQDQLYLQVHRGEMNKNVKEYLIETSVTQNNSAKMCKHTSTPYLR